MIRSTFVRGTCLFGALTALALMGACSHGTAAKQGEPGMEASTQGGMNEQMAQACPMSIPGTQVAAKDTDNGAALEFTTTNSDQLEALRQKVQALADMHNKMIDQMQGQKGQMQGQTGMSGQGGAGSSGQGEAGVSGQAQAGSSQVSEEPSQGQAGSSQVSEQPSQGQAGMSGQGGSGCLVAGAKASVENTDNGARLVFQPSDQVKAEDLRQSVRNVASQMSSGTCPMQACMQGSMGAQPGQEQPGTMQPQGGTENQGGTMQGTPQQGTEQQGQTPENEGSEQGGTESQPGSSGY